MAEKKEEANVVMLKGLRLNMFNDQIYFPEAEMTTKGKHKGKYRFNWSSKFILPKKDSPEGIALLEQIRAAMVAGKEIKWKEKAAEIKIKGANTPLQNGDDEEVTTFAAMKGCYFMSASKTVYGALNGSETDVPKRPFRVIGPRKVRQEDGTLKFPDVKPGEEGAPYSGCYVNLKAEFWGQDSDSERGIATRMNSTILAIQFARHGDSFGGGTRVDVDNDFDEEGDDDGSDDMDPTPASKPAADDDLGI